MQSGWLNGRLALCAAAFLVAGLQLGQSVAPAVVSLKQLAQETREQPQDQDEHDDAPQDVAITEQMFKVVLRRAVWLPRPKLTMAATAPGAGGFAFLTRMPKPAGTIAAAHPNHCPPWAVRLLL